MGALIPERTSGYRFNEHDEALRALLSEDGDAYVIDDMMFRRSDYRLFGVAGNRWPDKIVYYSFDASCNQAMQDAFRSIASIFPDICGVHWIP
jgi:hypothetical protein